MTSLLQRGETDWETVGGRTEWDNASGTSNSILDRHVSPEAIKLVQGNQDQESMRAERSTFSRPGIFTAGKRG